MAQRTDLKESAAPGSSVTSSSGPEDSSEHAGPSKQSETGKSAFRTIQILKEWPMIKSTVNKTQDFYESLKRKSSIFKWSCSLAEKTVGVLCDRSSTVLSVMFPAVCIADLAASYAVEELQKKLPIVRQTPYQVAIAVRSRLSNLVHPLVEKTAFPFRKCRKWTRKAAKSVAEMLRKLVLCLDRWAYGGDDDEYDYNSKWKEIKALQEQQQQRQQQQQQQPPPTVSKRRHFYHEYVDGPPPPMPCPRSGRPYRSLLSGPAVCCPDCVTVLLAATPSSSSSSSSFSSADSSKATSPVRQPALPFSQPSSESATAAGVDETVPQLQNPVIEPIPECQTPEDEKPPEKIL